MTEQEFKDYQAALRQVALKAQEASEAFDDLLKVLQQSPLPILAEVTKRWIKEHEQLQRQNLDIIHRAINQLQQLNEESHENDRTERGQV